ncbi:MAG: tetratricopeptide repeat protein, partial [Phormidesmis sp.]
LAQDDYDAALSPLERSISLDASRSSVYATLGSIWLEQGNESRAFEAFQSAVRLNANDAESQFNLGRILLDRGDDNAALSHLEQAVKYDSGLLPAQAALGGLLLARGQYLRAVLSYRHLSRAFPEDAGVRYNLGLALWGQGNQNAAIETLQQALRLYERQDDTVGIDRATSLLEVWRE